MTTEFVLACTLYVCSVIVLEIVRQQNRNLKP